MSRFVSRFCLRQIVICCLVCSSVLLVVLLNNRPSNFNDYVSTVLRIHRPTKWDDAVAEVQQLERKNRVKEKCSLPSSQVDQSKRINVTTPVIFKVDDRHRVMYCDVPKVATTNLKGLMLILSGTVETDDLSSIPRLSVHEWNPMRMVYASSLNDTIENGVGDYTKFIFVRHPLERLVSAYQDKLVRNNTTNRLSQPTRTPDRPTLPYHKNVGRQIVQKYRKEPSRLALQMGHDVTFPEFVSFVIDEWMEAKRPLDTHWRPVVDLCLPFVMRFDFIGKFETLNQDVDFLLRKLNESDQLGRLFAAQSSKPKTTSILWKEFMNRISYQQLSDLNRMYAEDFRLFGYPHYYVGKPPIE